MAKRERGRVSVRPTMARSTIFRCFGVSLGLAGLLALAGLVHFGVSALSEPYSRSGHFTVGDILEPARAGALQPGDLLLSLNGQRVSGCVYLIGSPLYIPGAGQAVSVPVRYRRPSTNAEAETRIVLTAPSGQETLERYSLFAVPSIFVVAGMIILLGGAPGRAQLLIGLAWCSVGLTLAGWVKIYESPLSIFGWAGVAVSATLLVAAHTIWPVYQLHRPVVRRMLMAIAALGLAYLGGLWLGSHFDCRPGLAVSLTGAAYQAGGLLYYSLALAGPGYLYLIVSAYRATPDPFSRLQIRAIAWAAGLGLGPVTLLTFLALPWTASSDVALLLTGLLPITYLFVFYQGELLRIDRYLNRLVFAFLFGAFWLALTTVIVRGLAQLHITNNLLIGIAAALPPLLFAAFARERLGMLVDLILYGVHYDYEAVVSRIGLALAGTLDEETLAGVVVRQLPQALSVRYAALWVMDRADQLRPVDLPAVQAHPHRSRPAADFPDGESEVEVFHQVFRLPGDGRDWHAMVRLISGRHLVGLALFGPKLRGTPYGERDVRTLRTLASWIATTVANIHSLAGQREAAARERELMYSLVENEERVRSEVAGELHDRGISALSVARLMVKQVRSPEVVSATLERVIADLRDLTYSRLSPAGLEQGLIQALTEMVGRQRALGVPVSLRVPEHVPVEATPVQQRELFYIAQEAVLNALKHARASQIAIALGHEDGRLKLTVRDDGQGFEVEALRAGRERRGLGIMQARANRVGAVLSIQSTSGRGSEVTVTLPSG